MNYPKFLASSVDPTQLSLTIESFSKVLIGLVGWYAVSKGFNVMTATTQVQAIVDLIAQAMPMAFTLWNSMLTIWGLVRKLFAYFATPPVTSI